MRRRRRERPTTVIKIVTLQMSAPNEKRVDKSKFIKGVKPRLKPNPINHYTTTLHMATHTFQRDARLENNFPTSRASGE
jgi:hypothetical protein